MKKNNGLSVLILSGMCLFLGSQFIWAEGESAARSTAVSAEEDRASSIDSALAETAGAEVSEDAQDDAADSDQGDTVDGQLMAADFDTGDRPNNLGGDFGGWDKDPNDNSQGVKMSFASDDSTGNMDGYALRLDYDVDSPSPAYNGFWMKLENLNATPYDTLSFYARGASKRYTPRLKVELKSPDSRKGEFFVSGITNEWKKFEIPLKRFKGIKDWSILGELVLVFDDVNTAPKRGTLLVDQIMFERKEGGMAASAPALPASETVVSDGDSSGVPVQPV